MTAITTHSELDQVRDFFSAQADALIRREALTSGQCLFARNGHVYADQITRMVIDAEDFLPYLEAALRERRKKWIR